ncbi:hypothetical protein ACFR9U_04635 [Halorientalis brevis]|uniref:RING-type E3 ubiquitin transferase n=1 Tax=Halorientalis brevis TaxID=1126241 RepID=A0ABD6C7I3_9EURY|nr:hypothetical protein [Halorientalis brevis]
MERRPGAIAFGSVLITCVGVGLVARHPVTLAHGVGILFGAVVLTLGLAGVLGVGKTGVTLLRYVFPQSRGRPESVAGAIWVKIEGQVHAESERVETVLNGPAVVRETELRLRETIRGLPWGHFTDYPSERSGVPFRVVTGESLVVDPGESPTIIEHGMRSETGRAFGADSDPPASLTDFLDAHGKSFEPIVFDGRIFSHTLCVDERVIESGDTVRLFGKVSLETETGDWRLRPAGGVLGDCYLSPDSWGAIRTHLLANLLWGAVLSPVFLFVGAILVWPP